MIDHGISSAGKGRRDYKYRIEVRNSRDQLVATYWSDDQDAAISVMQRYPRKSVKVVEQ